MKKLVIVSFCLLLSGCATYTTQVISDPPGARIEVDGAYLGDAPMVITWKTLWPGGLLGGYEFHRINALPTHAGHCVQSKTFSGALGERLPNRIFFDTGLCRQTPAIDVNVR